MRATLIVNGDRHDLVLEPGRTLTDVLHHDCGLAGARVGCTDGMCGGCTVLVDGEPVRSCLMLAVQCDGAEVRTVEG
jgi:carbon-monoxide dehydrogenase small subunit